MNDIERGSVKMLEAIQPALSLRHYGRFNLGNDTYFFKKVGYERLQQEVEGSRFIARYYPTPNIRFVFPSEGIVVFENEITVSLNQGLLLDVLIDEQEVGTSEIAGIINIYKKIFSETCALDRGSASDIFFRDRMKTRIPAYYSEVFLKDEHRFTLNGREVCISLYEVISRLEKFFSCRSDYWCVAAQCDPGDLNIGLKPTLFDCTGGGMIPLMAEFAVLFWYQIAQGNYFSPKYHREAFFEHERVFEQIDTIDFFENSYLTHRSKRKRIEFLSLYTKTVIDPIVTRNKYTRWHEDFFCFLAMRILGIFNISKMERKDLLLSLGYLSLFSYTEDLERPSDLLCLLYGND